MIARQAVAAVVPEVRTKQLAVSRLARLKGPKCEAVEKRQVPKGLVVVVQQRGCLLLSPSTRHSVVLT